VAGKSVFENKKHLKNVGPIRHASRRTPIQQVRIDIHDDNDNA